ncbi:MAG: hypothetical protein PHI13_09625, partial [Methylococcales bacterium]|nr:hypothetical protein [Methylococcales bacterium]
PTGPTGGVGFLFEGGVTSSANTPSGFLSSSGISIAGEAGSHRLVGTTCANVKLLASLTGTPAGGETYDLQVRQGTGIPYSYASLGSVCNLSSSTLSCTINATSSLTAFNSLGVQITLNNSFNTGTVGLTWQLTCS